MTAAAVAHPVAEQAPVLAPDATPVSITDAVSDVVLLRRDALSGTALRAWWIALTIALALTGLFAASIYWVLYKGVGVWGLNIPVAWSFAIANYVWWIAIGMGGTFISAALYLMRADWRAAINRYAEAMTLFAVCVSGIFPILHLGRPYFFYWLFPYPDTMNVWPQWRSSLFWDFAAILAYLLFSAMYWYSGLIPDLATLRDRARTRGKQVFYGLLALGWRGEARQWRQMDRLMLLMAAMAVPLVFSVHSMVALDFSEALLPGWHSTIFPPFFVVGALHSGFAMVLLLGIPIRFAFGLQQMITPRHLDNMARLILATSLVMAYCYGAEIFTAFYSGDLQEISTAQSRFSGAYAWVYWSTWVCNVLAVQILWWPRMRRSQPVLLAVAALILIGMWLERFMLIVTSLYQGVVPSSWGMFHPTFWDFATLAGSIGLFMLLLLLFVRWLPVLSMHELRKLAHEREADS